MKENESSKQTNKQKAYFSDKLHAADWVLVASFSFLIIVPWHIHHYVLLGGLSDNL